MYHNPIVYFQVSNGVLYFLDYEDIYIMVLSVKSYVLSCPILLELYYNHPVVTNLTRRVDYKHALNTY